LDGGFEIGDGIVEVFEVQVEAGAPLVRIEPLDTAGPTSGGTRVRLPEQNDGVMK